MWDCEPLFFGFRRYEELWQERTNARAAFRSTHPRINGRRVTMYPSDLDVMPSFEQWFRLEIEAHKQEGRSIPDDVENSSNLPSMQAHRFKSMYAYGYHYMVKNAEDSITKTCDSGVATFFSRPCRSGRRDEHLVEAKLEYIGQILEIVELNYGRHCTVLLVCDWVKANYKGRKTTVKKNEWGFTIANFNAMVPFGYESFAFLVPKFFFQM